MRPRPRTVLIAALLVTAAACSGTASCANNPSASVTPQAKVAHYSADVLDAVTIVQKTVTQGVASNAIPVETGRQITSVIENINDNARKLGETLKLYDAATTLADRSKAGADAQSRVAAISALLSQGFGVIKVDNATGAEIVKLLSNVTTLVANISTEVAKGLS